MSGPEGVPECFVPGKSEGIYPGSSQACFWIPDKRYALSGSS